VRHSVFIVGNAGTGKTMVWKSLLRANQNMKKKPISIDLNPKAVTNNELFGIINPSTREWKDGRLCSSNVFVIFRNNNNNNNNNIYSLKLKGADSIGLKSLAVAVQCSD